MSTNVKVIPIDEEGNLSKGLVVELGKAKFRIWFDVHALNRKIIVHGCDGSLQVNPLDINEVSISHTSFGTNK